MQIPGELIYQIIHELYVSLEQHSQALLQLQKDVLSTSPAGCRYGLTSMFEQHITDRSQFASLCLVSRLFCNFAQPLLHRCFQDKESILFWAGDLCFAPFMRTLLGRPNLARQVRKLRLQLCHNTPLERPGYPYHPLDDTAAAELNKQLNTASLELTGEEWIYHDDSRLLLLFALCKNTEELHLTCNTGCSRLSENMGRLWALRSDDDEELENVYKLKVARYADLIFQQLTKLRHLTYHYLYLSQDEIPDFWDLRPFLQLPQLTRLHLNQVFLMTSDSYDDQHIKFFNLSEVQFENSLWTVDGVEDLFRYCPQLKVLKLGLSTHVEGDKDRCSLNFERLGDALRQYGTGLTKFTIDARGAYGYDVDEPSYNPLLGSLKPLVCLRELYCPLVQLIHIWDNDFTHYELVGPHGTEGFIQNPALFLRLQEEILPDSIKHVYLLDQPIPDSESSTLLDYSRPL